MADEETVDEDPDAFECDECPVRTALEDLDAPNREAWNVYRKVVTRLAADFYAGGLVLDRLTQGMDRDDFDDLWRRLVILYNAIQPPPVPPKEQ